MAEGEFALVQQHLEQALQKQTANFVSVFNNASWAGDHDLYAMLADSAAQQQDEAALRQYAPLAEELAMRYGHRLYQAIAHRSWGVAHRLAREYAAAETRLQQALELFTALETRWQIARTLSNLGDLERARANPIRAREYYTQALAIFEKLQALPDIERTRATLETVDSEWQHGVSRPQDRTDTLPAPPRMVGDELLTAREVEVLRWLAQGLSDKEIAEQLVISVYTVRGHLRSIYSKLDVTSRSGAIRVALDHHIV